MLLFFMLSLRVGNCYAGFAACSLRSAFTCGLSSSFLVAFAPLGNLSINGQMFWALLSLSPVGDCSRAHARVVFLAEQVGTSQPVCRKCERPAAELPGVRVCLLRRSGSDAAKRFVRGNPVPTDKSVVTIVRAIARTRINARARV